MLRVILVLFAVVTYTYAYCFASNGRVDKTASGQMIPVCEYNGLDLLDGSTFKTAGCLECACRKGVLHCCGYGINAGVISPPPGCRVIPDGCRPVMVMETDPKLDCFTGMPVQFTKEQLPVLPMPGTGTEPGTGTGTGTGTGSGTGSIDPFMIALIRELAAAQNAHGDPLLTALSEQLLGSNLQGNRITDMTSSGQPANQKHSDNTLNNLLLLRGLTEM